MGELDEVDNLMDKQQMTYFAAINMASGDSRNGHLYSKLIGLAGHSAIAVNILVRTQSRIKMDVESDLIAHISSQPNYLSC